MKQKKLCLLLASFLLLFSCESYDTTVHNTLHKDGSVSRKVIMRNTKNEIFERNKFKVPVDSTWNSSISMEINKNNDTVWILTADKLFMSIDEINNAYNNDSGTNKDLVRTVNFTKRFAWFTTVFRFSEKVEQALEISCSVTDFLTPEETEYYYSPKSIQHALENGPDSTQIKELIKSIEIKTEEWYMTCLVRQALNIFIENLPLKQIKDITKEEILSKEAEIVKMIDQKMSEDSILTTAFGKEFTQKYNVEIDSALKKTEKLFDISINAQSYDMNIKMPGTIISTNGYKTSDEEIQEEEVIWTVNGDYFLSEDYTMWVESRLNNYYAWVITGLFILFTVSGFLFYFNKKP